MILSNVYKAELSSVEMHEYCDLHPKMNEDQFKALTHSLLTDGQIQPVIVYRGKIVDGRHRYWASKENNMETILCMDMPRNTKLSDVRDFVMNTEKRRHQSKNQLTCAAYMDFVNPKTEAKTLSALAIDYGVSQAGVSQAKKVAEEFGIKIIESFLVGDKVNLAVNGTFSNYSTLTSIYQAMKRTKVEGWAKSQRLAVIGFNEGDERGRVRAFCINDSIDLLKFKQKEILELIITKEDIATRQAEEFGNE